MINDKLNDRFACLYYKTGWYAISCAPGLTFKSGSTVKQTPTTSGHFGDMIRLLKST